MTLKFEKAKAETIQKYTRVLEAIRVAKTETGGGCGFCYSYKCKKCPVYDLCSGDLRWEGIHALAILEEKLIESISLLEKVKE